LAWTSDEGRNSYSTPSLDFNRQIPTLRCHTILPEADFDANYDYIGGVSPSLPKLMRGACSVPSRSFFAARVKICIPGLSSLLSPRTEGTIGAFARTTLFFSPSLFFMLRTRPLTSVTACSMLTTLALVMVLCARRSHE